MSENKDTKTVIKRFDFKILNESDRITKTFDLDKNIVHVIGMLVTSNKDQMLYFRGDMKLELNKDEIFPEGYESKLLMSGINVGVNHRYYDVNKPAGQGKIDILYQDNADPSISIFQPYAVRLYVKCEQEKDLK